MDSVGLLGFSDVHLLNATTLLVCLLKTIVLARDQTVIDLSGGTKNPLDKFKVGTVLQKKSDSEAEGEQLVSKILLGYTDSHLEEYLLQPVFSFLTTLARSPVLRYLPAGDRMRLYHCVFFNLLGISSLKLA